MSDDVNSFSNQKISENDLRVLGKLGQGSFAEVYIV
jgi:hypothetical protein